MNIPHVDFFNYNIFTLTAHALEFSDRLCFKWIFSSLTIIQSQRNNFLINSLYNLHKDKKKTLSFKIK
jgi:hypothetical protein